MRRPCAASSAFTVAELLVTVLILAVLTGMTALTWHRRFEQGRADFATTQLALIWHAEKRFFAYQGGYTSDWQSLGMMNPSGGEDHFYDYSIQADVDNFTAQARERASSSCLQIDKSGSVIRC